MGLLIFFNLYFGLKSGGEGWKFSGLVCRFYLDSRRMYWQQIWFTSLVNGRHFSHWSPPSSSPAAVSLSFHTQGLLKDPPSYWFSCSVPKACPTPLLDFFPLASRATVLPGYMVRGSGLHTSAGVWLLCPLGLLSGTESSLWGPSRIWCGWNRSHSPCYQSWSDACTRGTGWMPVWILRRYLSFPTALRRGEENGVYGQRGISEPWLSM